MPSNLIDTSKVSEHRGLQFKSIDEVLAEIDRIVASDRSGKLRRSGNWTAGQVFGHLATWINFSYEGYPPGSGPPWFIKPLLRMKKNQYLRNGMPLGVRIPRVENGTFGTEIFSTDEGARRLRQALARVKNGEPVRHHSPAFGKMVDSERIAFILRHADVHFGFLWP